MSNNSSGASVRESFPCPYCHTFNRTQGWLTWHLKHKHTEVTSPARARNGDPDKYIKGEYGHLVNR